MTLITDPITALIRYLKADADTSGMVGTRVFGGELPDSENALQPRANLVLRNAGGGVMPIGSNSLVHNSDMRIDAYAYGSTPNQAFRLYRCVAGALKQMPRNVQGKTLLHWANPAGGPLNQVEPQTEWPLTLSSWQVLWAETETP